MFAGLWCTLWIASPVRPAVAQQVCAGGGWSWIGVDAYHCPGGSCSFLNPRSGAPAFEFTTEPWLRAVDERGPAAGLLADGDVLVAVNGLLITSVRGGEELARLGPGSAARLTVRRGDRLHEIVIMPEQRCNPPTLIHGNAVVRAHGRIEMASSVHSATTSHDLGLGMGLRCEDCEPHHGGDGAPYVPRDHPHVIAVVEGGAAEQAGVQEGDRITRVNSLDIRTAEAVAALFGTQPGDTVTLELLGPSGALRTATLVKSDVRFTFDHRIESAGHHDRGLVSRLLGRFRDRDHTGHGDPDDDGLRHVIRDRHVIRTAGSPWRPAAFGFTLRPCDGCEWGLNDGLAWDVDSPLTVTSLVNDGAAARAGIRAGDIITHVGGHDIRSADAGHVLLSSPEGIRVEVRLLRSGRARTVTVTTR